MQSRERWEFQCLLHGFIFVLALADKVPSCCTFSSDYDFISSEFEYDLKVKLGGGQDLKFFLHATLRVFNPSKGHFNLCLDGVIVIDFLHCYKNLSINPNY